MGRDTYAKGGFKYGAITSHFSMQHLDNVHDYKSDRPRAKIAISKLGKQQLSANIRRV